MPKKRKLHGTWINGEYWYNTACTNRFHTAFIGVPVQKDFEYLEGMIYRIELSNPMERYTRFFYTYEEAYEFFCKVRLADSILEALNDVQKNTVSSQM